MILGTAAPWIPADAEPSRIQGLPRLNPFRHRFSRPVLYRRNFFAMGTTITVTVAAEKREARTVEAAIADVQSEIVDFGHQAWSWGSGSLANFNRQLNAGDVAPIPAALVTLFRRAWEIHQITGKRFEPRIGQLVRLWGFDDVARLRSTPPEASELERLLDAIRRAPEYDGSEVYGPAPGLAWDFGALGKGHIVDRGLAQLASAGFADATIDAGGHVGIRGRRHGVPWRVGIRDPGGLPQESAGLLATLDAGDESVVTHGDDQRYFEHDGRRYAHLLDPRTGWPVQGLRSLTVVHGDGGLADAAGAALFVAGAEDWPAVARELGIAKTLAMRTDGRVQVSRELAMSLRWMRPVEPCIVSVV